jgi:two-component system, response regulator PdtaR
VKVLIADDDQLIRTMLAAVLAELGHTVVAAVNGAEAVELCERERPDAVIVDFLMPKLSGLEALRRMRAGGRPLPAVLLTAISDGSVRAVGGLDTPDAILEKPFRRKTVAKALAQALRSA